MRRLAVFVLIFTVVPASAAWAVELDELLERSSEASYSAEPVITCATPDGPRDAIVWLAQSSGEIHIGSKSASDVEIAAGYGGWTLSDGEGVVTSAAVDATEESARPAYVVEGPKPVLFLDRPAMSHQLFRDGVLRAELIFDNRTSAMVGATTFTANGDTYCERRFVSFDATDPGYEGETTSEVEELVPSVIETALPESAAGFDRLDLYEDDYGVRFGYYSDGFFSFAVFETATTVELPGAATVEFFESTYSRSFTAGQVTYAWETADGGMALVGDLPPDLHEAVLEALPDSERPSIFRRIWRTLFG